MRTAAVIPAFNESERVAEVARGSAKHVDTKAYYYLLRAKSMQHPGGQLDSAIELAGRQMENPSSRETLESNPP